ncbi:uncharacterized protein LOC114165287, partial [Vigna unguiculata]|uniref:uncharacterized protein LOC114165287 n=1 Tax=Vigna unguiculata TaxID=3917 RepID=UPI0010162FDE
MQAVMVALEGKALNWFQWWETCHQNPSWEEFKVAVVRRFQPTMLQNPFEILIGLSQNGTVDEYIQKFEMYAGFLKGIEQEYLVGIFLNGLKDDIKAEVKLYDPATLADLMLKAQMVEEKIRVHSKAGYSSLNRSTTTSKPYIVTRSFSREPTTSGSSVNFNDGKGKSGETTSIASNTSGGQRLRGAPFRKLSEAELQEK